VLYIERPTITYNPLTGDDFSRQLLTPIPSDLIFSLIDEYKGLLQLDRGRSSYRVTEQLARREADEVTIRVRSILTLMRFLATGVDVPAPLRSHSWRPAKIASGGNAPGVERPLKVYSSEDPPEAAFVAVRYHDYWYYIKSKGRTRRANRPSACSPACFSCNRRRRLPKGRC
jgi:hypothetical protein